MMQCLCHPLVLFRVIIMVFQSMGSYHYRWPSENLSSIPRFSVPLFLWTLFTKILIISLLIEHIVHRHPSFFTVGDVLAYITIIVSSSIFAFTSVLMAVKTKSLTRVLEGLIGLLREFNYSKAFVKQQFWLRNNLDVLIPFSSTVSVVLCVIYITTHYPLPSSPVCSLVKLLSDFVKMIGVPLFCILNKFILKVLWVHLRASSLQCFENLSNDKKNGPENQAKSKLALLYQFESEVRKVEIVRDDAVSYFGSVISGLFLSITVLLITKITQVINNSNWDAFFISGLFLVINAVVILYFLCDIGQEFTDEMDKTSGQLRDLSIISGDADIKAQVSRLILQLDNLKTINVFGWYPLNHGTLVSIASFVATYVVVLLQVGQQNLETSSAG